MKVYIAGVMQGSRQDHDVHGQDYRQLIANRIRARHPDAEVIDPWEIHPGAASYSPQRAKETLLEELELASTCDLLIAYLPEASMGTALEMWSAYEAGAKILCISLMNKNWVVQSLSVGIFPTLDDFLELVDEGRLLQALDGQ